MINSPMLRFIKVTQTEQFQQVTDIANIVFHEVYDQYTPQDYVNNFINTHQSPSSIQLQIEQHNFHYFLLKSKKK